MASLPNTPFTDIDSARVAVDAPVSTDLMTDIVVDLNYLKSAVDILAGLTADYFLSTGTWTCPAGVTQIKYRGWGQGGGAGAGGDAAVVGGDGGVGVDSYFDSATYKARGGNPGGGGHAGTTMGTGPNDIAPTIASKAMKFGSQLGPFAIQNGAAHSGGVASTSMKWFELLKSANGGLLATPIDGNPGTTNTGQGGGGGAGDSGGGGGAPGAPGEYAEYIITVVPGATYNVVVGDSSNGGAKNTSAPGNGGKGGKGLVILEY